MNKNGAILKFASSLCRMAEPYSSMTYQTGVSSIFSSSASRYVIRYSHIAPITLSARGSSGDHSGSRG
uniref:Uncharacterized protein n=1 Tax=Arundo donax TaxID=35708 RepID=A0A0A9DW09_ARUDO